MNSFSVCFSVKVQSRVFTSASSNQARHDGRNNGTRGHGKNKFGFQEMKRVNKFTPEPPECI